MRFASTHAEVEAVANNDIFLGVVAPIQESEVHGAAPYRGASLLAFPPLQHAHIRIYADCPVAACTRPTNGTQVIYGELLDHLRAHTIVHDGRRILPQFEAQEAAGRAHVHRMLNGLGLWFCARHGHILPIRVGNQTNGESGITAFCVRYECFPECRVRPPFRPMLAILPSASVIARRAQDPSFLAAQPATQATQGATQTQGTPEPHSSTPQQRRRGDEPPPNCPPAKVPRIERSEASAPPSVATQRPAMDRYLNKAKTTPRRSKKDTATAAAPPQPPPAALTALATQRSQHAPRGERGAAPSIATIPPSDTTASEVVSATPPP